MQKFLEKAKNAPTFEALLFSLYSALRASAKKRQSKLNFSIWWELLSRRKFLWLPK